MLIKMIVLTVLLLIVSTFTMVGSAYYSDKNYSLGKLLWRISIVSGGAYGLSALATIIMAVLQFLDFLF